MSAKVEIQKIYSLSPMQESMLFHSLLDPESVAYFEQMLLELKGNLDAALFEESFNRLIQRYDILRTIFLIEEVEKPLQVVLKERRAKIRFEDISALDEEQQSQFITNYKLEDRSNRFDLSSDLLIRLSLIKRNSDRFTIVWSFHHILMDGWCISILMQDFNRIYSGLKENAPLILPNVKPYQTYIKWLEQQDRDSAIAYWKDYLSGYEELAGLPKKNKSAKAYKYAELNFLFEESLSAGLSAVAVKYNTTLNTVFHAIWGAILQRWNNAEEVVFGAVVSGRPSEISGIEEMVGLFINTLPVRVKRSAHTTFPELLESLFKAALAADRFSFLPLSEIQAQSPLKQNLLDHIIIFENFPVAAAVQEEVSEGIAIYDAEVFEQTNYDLNIVVSPGAKLHIKISYNDNVYDADVIEDSIASFKQIAVLLSQNSDLKLKDICLAKKEDYLNPSPVLYSSDRTICDLFEEAVAKHPEKTALVFEGEKLSYAQLNQQANQLARYLQKKGFKKGDIAAILLEHSFDLIRVIFAVMKAGGAYLPIDPEYPGSRKQYLLEDSASKWLITSEEQASSIAWTGERIIMDRIDLEEVATDNLNISLSPEDVVYVIYTSGSTGKPKGAMITHKGLLNYITWASKTYLSGEALNFPLYSSISFDLTVTSVFTPLVNSSSIVIYKQKDKETLIRKILEEDQVGVIKLTPVHLQILQHWEFSNHNLKAIIVGGEELKAPLVKDILQKFDHPVRLFNEYGPTETVVGCTAHEYNEQFDIGPALSIGKPGDNVKIYIIDRYGQLQPAGMPGEIIIGGDGVAKGYLHRSELTAEKFSTALIPGERVYRTGDLGLWKKDGNIDFLGRIDEQLKIRGFRIEPGEIESVLADFPGIREALVIGQTDHTGDKTLCAYYVSETEHPLPALKKHIAKVLPEYMIPTFFVRMDHLPLTPNGKVDRKVLPKPEASGLQDHVYVAPKSKTELQLALIFKEILGRDKIGLNDNFFLLGGHSLKATLLLSRVHKAFNKSISLSDIFKDPTIAGIAKQINEQETDLFASIEPVAYAEKYPVSAAQQRMYILSQMEGASQVYNISGAFELQGDIDEIRLEKAFNKIIERHESLRTSFISEAGEVFQVVHDKINFQLERLFSDNPDQEKVLDSFVPTFKFTKAPLLHAALIRMKDGKSLLAFSMHHIISDGISMNIIMEEFSRIYNGESLPAPKLQYKDYAVWQQKPEAKQQLEKQENYWKQQFTEPPIPLNLPTDFSRPPLRSFAGDRVLAELSEEDSLALKTFCGENNSTPFMVLLSAFKVLLYRYTRQKDIVVGIPVSGRSHADLHGIVGMFVNTLALRSHASPGNSFLDFLNEVKESALKAMNNQDLPFAELLNFIAIPRDLSRNPLFDVMFSFQEAETAFSENPSSSGLRLNPIVSDHHNSKFDLTLEAMMTEGKIHLGLEYCTSLFKRDTAQSILDHFIFLLKALITEPLKMLGDFELVTDAEKNKLLNIFSYKSPAETQVIANRLSLNLLPDAKFYVFSEYLRLQAPGVPGELFISERGLIPEDIKKFKGTDLYQNPYSSEKIYNTGHIAKWLLDGDLVISGKADEETRQTIVIDEVREFIAPVTAIQKQITSIWQEVLGKKKISTRSNFFELGGHSLKATVVISRIFKALNKEISLSDFFKNPTVEGLADLIETHAEGNFQVIGKAPVADHYPLSSSQHRLFLLQQIENDPTFYNTPGAVLLDGPVDVDKIENVFRQLIQRHEAFRTSFGIHQGEPVQRIADHVGFSLELNEEIDGDNILHNFVQPFDLSKAPLLRAGLVKKSDGSHVLWYDMHHIITDGVSASVFMEEFSKIYKGESLEKPVLQYKDYVCWQKARTKETQDTEAYWLKKFAGDLPVLNIPLDFVRPALQSFEGDRIFFSTTEELYKRLKDLCLQQGCTFNSLLLSAFSVLLKHFSGQNDIAIGAPVAGRPHPDLEKTIGLFVNTLVHRIKPGPEKTFLQLLSEVKAETLTDYENAGYSYEEIIEKLAIERDLSRNPLFDVMFVMQNTTREVPQNNGLSVRPYEFPFMNSKFDLTLEAAEDSGHLSFSLEYGTRLFKRSTVERIAQQFLYLLNSISVQPDQLIEDINLVEGTQRAEILEQFGRQEVDFPVERPLHLFFSAQVQQSPDQIALKYEDQVITYSELNRRINGVANALKKLGAGRDKIVALRVERSVEMIVFLYGILKSGAAYLPIGTDYPADRIDFILEDSKAIIYITDQVKESETTGEIVMNTGNSCWIEDLSEPINHTISSDLAYVIYTSGSTGMPKGVMIEHCSIVNRIYWMQQHYPLSPSDVILQKTPYTFDVSVWEIFWWSFAGASVSVLKANAEKDPQEIVNTINKHRVTIMHFVPSMLNAFLDHTEVTGCVEQLTSLRRIFASGDALAPSTVHRFYQCIQSKKGTHLTNLYGPTEASVDVSYYDCEDPEASIIPIGKPIYNTGLFVLNARGHLLPVGVPGELCISGVGLARAYLNRPDLTKEKFIQHPEFGRIYKTGDLAKYLEDGNIEYLGRMDHQVKIKGYRIELGEIENHLLKVPGIIEGTVIDRLSADNERYLCAYFVAGRQIDETEVRKTLSAWMPHYMVPAYFMQIKEMPLSRNGKLDRKKLPLPQVFRKTGFFESPLTLTEKQIAKIWSALLKVEQVGRSDNYFHLGGDSLKALRVVVDINKCFGSDLRIGDIFSRPVLKELALFLDQNEKTSGSISNLHQHGLSLIEEVRKEVESDPVFQQTLAGGYEDVYPWSPIEEGMIYSSLLKPAEPVYYDQFVYFLDIPDQHLFIKALELMVKKHPIFRTAFYINRFKEKVKVVLKNISMPISFENISHLSASEQEERIIAFRAADLGERYTFNGEILWRMKAFVLDGKNVFLVWTFHHAILDGWSTNSFVAELAGLSNQKALMEISEIPMLKSSYKDYCAIALARNDTDAPMRFWKQTLEGYTRNKLPFNISGKRKNERLGMLIIEQSLEDSLLTGLQSYAADNKVSLKSLCLAAFVYWMHATANENDVVIGSVSHDRPEIEDGDKILGCFLNSIPVRIDMSDFHSNKGLVQNVDRYLQDVKRHELYLADIAKAIGERTSLENPIFDCLFNYLDFHILESIEGIATPTGPAPELSQHLFESSEMTNTLLDLEVSKTLGRFSVRIKYAAGLFNDHEMAYGLDLYIRILKQFLEGEKVNNNNLFTREEYKSVVFDFNNTLVPYGVNKTLHLLFEEQAKLTPSGIALIYGDQSMSYAMLNQYANQLARHLIEEGIENAENVALIAERSFEMIIGMLAILKAGGAYVPIDPDYPLERQAYIIQNSNSKIVLSDQKPFTTAGTDRLKFIRLDRDLRNTYDSHDLNLTKSSGDLAYTIYTSGSTGRPKGVMIEHHSAVNLVEWVNKKYNVNEKDCLLFITSMCFDLSVYDIFGMLASGGTVVIADKQELRDVFTLKDLMVSRRITFWDSVPTTFNYLMDIIEEADGYQQHDLRLAFLSGDWIPVALPERIKKSFPSVKVISLGGATEGTVWSNYYEVENVAKDQVSIPYGKPIHNNAFYILNDRKELAPIGAAGELYIGGVGVARGYANDQEKTEAAFFKNPFATGKMYKTGDLGRFLPDGNMEFLGRKDHQVKIRGFRVELGEVENQLQKHPSVRAAVVVDKTDERKVKYLCAYVVAEDGLNTQDLKLFLAKTLPDYMIPGVFVQIESIPLTANGKVDRKALPDKVREDNAADYFPASTPAEIKLEKIWKEVLGVPMISVTDSFFDLGGHSLMVVTLINKVNQEFGVNLPLLKVFETPVFKTISEYIEYALGLNKVTEEQDVVLLNQPAERKLFFFPPGVGYSLVYGELASRLKDIAFYGFNFIEKEDPIDQYISLITSYQPEGPYVLGGYSSGGNLAYHVAKAMTEKGMLVSDIIMLDSFKKSAPIIMTVEERIKYIEAYVEPQAGNSNTETLLTPELKTKVKQKVAAYFDFLNEREETEAVGSSIHLLKSADKPDPDNRDDWRQVVKGTFYKYPGKGTHMEMLTDEGLAYNGELLNKILNHVFVKIAAKKKALLADGTAV